MENARRGLVGVCGWGKGGGGVCEECSVEIQSICVFLLCVCI